MSRPNRNKKIIDLSNNESRSQCSSSSSSSNSDDGDSIKNISESSPSLKTPSRLAFASNGHGAFKGGSEAPTADVFYMHRTPTQKVSDLESDEKQFLSTVDARKNPPSAADESESHTDNVPIVDQKKKDLSDCDTLTYIERFKTKVDSRHKLKSSRNIFELSEEQLKKLHSKGLKISELKSGLRKTREVVKLLLDTGSTKPLKTSVVVSDEKITLKREAAKFSQLEPIAKKQRDLFASTKADSKLNCGNSTENPRKIRLGSGNIDQRTRFLRQLLKQRELPVPVLRVINRSKIVKKEDNLPEINVITTPTTTITDIHSALNASGTSKSSEEREIPITLENNIEPLRNDMDSAKLLVSCKNCKNDLLNNIYSIGK